MKRVESQFMIEFPCQQEDRAPEECNIIEDILKSAGDLGV